MNPLPVTIEIEKYRSSTDQRSWELPPWAHPLSFGVLPLFITYQDHLFPVGTAFTIGRGISFMVSAAHNIYEALKREERLWHRLNQNDLPPSVNLTQAGIAILHQTPRDNTAISFNILPVETVEGAPPSDLVIGYPKFKEGVAMLVNKLSFELPRIGERVWSIGYADMKPNDGIPISDLRAGRFDIMRDYSHRLIVVEGYVERIFTQRFATGFVGGPCFSFDAEIAHGQSGGPVMYPDGTICGVNSAVTAAFGQPRAIASLLFPMLFKQLRFGLTFGPMRLNAAYPMIDLVFENRIATDGSEERIAICHDEPTNTFTVSPKIPIEDTGFVHDDFASFEQGRTATSQTKVTYRFRRTEAESVPMNTVNDTIS
jgi:hypothetical protein